MKKMEIKYVFQNISKLVCFLVCCGIAPVTVVAQDTSIYIQSDITANSYYTQRLDTKRIAMGIDTSESTLLVGLRQPFSFGLTDSEVGMVEIDDEIEVSQLKALLHTKYIDITIGKTELRNTIIPFDIVRQTDLIEYTHVLNGETQSGSFLEGPQLYAPIIASDILIGRNQKLGIWSSERDGHGDYNTVGGGYYFNSRGDDFVHRAGIIIDAHNVAHNDNWIYGIVAGIETGFSGNWNAAFQLIRTMGTNQSGELLSYSEMAGLDSYSVVMAVTNSNKYIHNTHLKSSVNIAFKQYSDVSEARQVDLVPNVQLELGETASVFAQMVYQYREASLREYKHGIRADIGLSYRMGAHW